MDSIADRIVNARKEQLAARRAGDTKSETTWTAAIDRLLDEYIARKRSEPQKTPS